MTTYSDAWSLPTNPTPLVLIASDRKYEWMMLASCRQIRRWLTAGVDIEVWTWGRNEFSNDVRLALRVLRVRIRRLPCTGEYCEGWEARHHALCLTNHRKVLMLDADTYINGDLHWLFEEHDSDMRLNAGQKWENYVDSRFMNYFKLPQAPDGYTNFSVWFGEYDRGRPACREVLRKTSALLGKGPRCYEDANVVGDQDIRNGFIHSCNARVEPIECRVDAWLPLEQQLADGNSVLHQSEKVMGRTDFEMLVQQLDDASVVSSSDGATYRAENGNCSKRK